MVKLISKSVKYLFVLAAIMFIHFSCDEIDSQIPEVYVNFPIDLNFYNDLQPGSSVFFQGYGFGGVIVSCLTYGEYYAYDAGCPYEINQSCRVEADGSNIGTCSCCGSKFQLFYTATPIEGPAAAPLKQYNTSLTGNTLRIYN